MISRRGVLVGASVTLLAPPAIWAQQANKVPRIGLLWGGETAFARPYVEAARRAFGELGHVEGKDFSIDYRFGERKPGAVNAGAAELVQLKVAVIVAAGDPVQAGFVASLARPGGNITGMTFLTRELAAKRLEILKEIVPTASRVAILWNPDNPGGLADFNATQAAATLLKLNLQSREVRTVLEFEGAFQAMADERAQGIVVLTDPLTATRAGKLIAELAAKHRLPTMCELREFTDAGGLISYGPSLLAMIQRAATFVDKILKGAKPADLPVEQPTTLELVINLKTAKALGLTIPQSLLVRADEIIQ